MYKICHPEIEPQEYSFVFILLSIKEKITIHFFRSVQTREGILISLCVASLIEV